MSAVADNKILTPVSVIMPAYNAAAYIEEAIRSVMAQTYGAWRLLVLDDGSADDTVGIVQRLAAEEPRITLLRNAENLGAARTRNRGWDLCDEGYVAFLDSDDRWHPEKLASQIALAEQTGADILYTSYAIIGTDGNPCRHPYIVPEHTDFNHMLKENVIGCSAVLLSPQAARAYRFSPSFYHEDYCLWLDMLRDGCRAAGCSRVLTEWRLVNGARSFDKKNGARQRWRIYREHLHLPLWKCATSFIGYAVSGIKKYGKKHKDETND